MAMLRTKLGEQAWQAAERARVALRSRYGVGEIKLEAEAIFTTGDLTRGGDAS
jgi:hypothetical protein